MLYRDYWKEVSAVLEHVMTTQAEKIEHCAKLVARSLAKDGMLYVFGCGHSHIIGEDLFYRAGGTAAVCAMLDSDLMLHTGAAKSSVYEKMSGLAQPVFERYGITDKDVLLVVSTSGINGVPVEMAMCAKEQGIPVIAIVSEAYWGDASRHPSGKKLHDVADIVLETAFATAMPRCRSAIPRCVSAPSPPFPPALLPRASWCRRMKICTKWARSRPFMSAAIFPAAWRKTGI